MYQIYINCSLQSRNNVIPNRRAQLGKYIYQYILTQSFLQPYKAYLKTEKVYSVFCLYIYSVEPQEVKAILLIL